MASRLSFGTVQIISFENRGFFVFIFIHEYSMFLAFQRPGQEAGGMSAGKSLGSGSNFSHRSPDDIYLVCMLDFEGRVSML